ncbi:MAG: XRE family transcriptional regulator [Oscillospiraceae bacterium]|nr:XRE family transcriptional regulator [Oscillospiraceae bacterium]
MDAGGKNSGQLDRQELISYLRRLAKWKNNDVVKLAFLEQEQIGQVDRLDLSGVVELRRNANGTFEAKFVDKVRVLAMLRELLDQRRDDQLEGFLDSLYRPEEEG